MSKTATVRARMELELKTEVESLLRALGVSHSEAINIFYRQIKLHHGLPFEVKIPNKLTQKVLDETEKKKNLIYYKNSKEMFDSLGI